VTGAATVAYLRKWDLSRLLDERSSGRSDPSDPVFQTVFFLVQHGLPVVGQILR
jgi:hypothetical protein